MLLDQAMHSVDGQALASTYVVDSQIFLWYLHFFIKIIVLAACFQKLAALHCTGRQRVQKLDTTGHQSHTNCIWVAASPMQIVPAWPPVACNMNKINGHSHATGVHTGAICMRLATTQVQFVCDQLPVAHYFSTIWQIVLTFSTKTERLHGQSAIAQTLCLA